MDNKTVEGLWVRIREQSNSLMGDILLGVSYRSPGQEEVGDEIVLRQLEKASH